MRTGGFSLAERLIVAGGGGGGGAVPGANTRGGGAGGGSSGSATGLTVTTPGVKPGHGQVIIVFQ